MSRLARRLWKWIAAAAAFLLILLAIGVGLFRLAVPMVPELRADAEAMAERALGLPVHIGEIDLQWALIGPELVLTDVQLLAPDSGQPLVMAAQLDIIFGPLDVFQDGVPRPSHVRLHQPTLALERGPDGRFSLSGYALPNAGEAHADWRKFLEAGLDHGRLTIYDGELHYRDLARGIDDWGLRVAEVTLASDGRHHELEGTVIPPDVLGEQLDIEFSAQGEPASPEAWEWTLDFEADALRLAGWYRQLGWSEDGPVQGELALAGRLSGQGLERFAGKGSLGITGLAFAEDSGNEGLPANFESIGLLWKAARDGSDFQVTTESLVIRNSAAEGRGTEEKAYHKSAAFSLHVRDEQSGDAYPLEIRAFRLPLAAVAGLTRLLPADSGAVLSKARDITARLAPRGEVQSLQLEMDTGADPPRFRVEAEFHGLGLRHWQELPGFTRLNGSIRGDQAAGEIRLDGQDVRVDFGELFRTPLPAEQLAASLSWQTATDGWHIRGRDILIANPGVTATADFILDLPSTGEAYIDLNATARDVDLAMRSTWLPVGIMSDTLIHWLDTAIIGGDVPEARLVLRGPLASFPFRDDSGTFDIRFETRDTTVEYAPGWPRVEGLRAQAHFHGPGLDIRVEQADVKGLAVNGGTVHFGDLREGLLEADATTTGDMARAWEFLAASPLQESLAGVLDALAVKGSMQARVALDIPLKNVAETRLTVDADLQGAAVHPVSLPWTVESLEGAVTVTESTITAENLAGQFTGHPFTASIAPVGSAKPQAPASNFLPARIRLRGRTPAGAFESFLPPAWLERLDGEFDWTGEMQVGDGEDFAIRIASDLNDLDSTLPAPLDIARPVTVDILLPGGSGNSGRIEAGFDMDGLGTGRIAFIDTGGEWRFDRGRLSLGVMDTGMGEGVERPALPNAPGLAIEGEVPVLDLGVWLAVGGAESDTGRPLIRSFAVDAAHMRAGGLILENQSLSGTRLDGSGWELLLAGPATGLVRIPSLHVDGQAWNVVLEQLHLPLDDHEGSDNATNLPPTDPRNLPELVFDIGDLRVGSVNLGEVHGSLQRTAIGYTTQDLSARGESFTLGLAGRWEVVGDEHYTSITSVLDSEDIGDTLAALGYEGGIDADDGRIEANLAWHAAPMAMEYGMLEGSVSFGFENGSLSEVSPGAGRLIGLLSLSALPRRLFLDFSDFFSEGLSFDTLKGDFLLTEGNAYTTNVRLEGPSLSALLVGRTGLAARDYDQLAIVDPGVSASLPVAGYLAAGPSVGAALLLLSQLLEAPLSDITQVKYRITGSWDAPVIERVQESNAPKQAQPAKQ